MQRKRPESGRRPSPVRVLRLFSSFLVIGGIFLAFYLLADGFGFTRLSVEELRAFVAEAGAWGSVVYLLLSFLQVTFLPIPSTVTILAGGLLFGPALAFLYSLVGIWLGSALAFFLGRRLGRPFVTLAAGDRETVDYYLGKTNGRELVVFFFMFLLPAFPDDLLCAIAGMTALKGSHFALIQLICRPIAIAATLSLMTGQIIPYHGWGLVAWALIVILSIFAFFLAVRRADRLSDVLDRVLSAVTRKAGKGNNQVKEQVMKEPIRKIASFTVDHTTLSEGMYISRVDGDITTFDLRTRRPNMGDYMDNATMHSLEHLFATYIRNSAIGESVIYFGPMGCQTGFYLLTRSVDPAAVKVEVIAALERILAHEGEIFGKSAVECGNYRNLDLKLGQIEAKRYLDILQSNGQTDFSYNGGNQA